MNKMVTSMLTVGAGIVAYNYAQKNNLISNRQMKKFKKSVRGIF